MSNENLVESEISEDDDELSLEDEESTEEDEGDEEGDDPYAIDVEKELSEERSSSPDKIDKALRLGFDIPVPEGFHPDKPPVSI